MYLCRYSFLDIGPIAKGHALVIPKCASTSSFVSEGVTSDAWMLGFLTLDHGEKLHDVPDEYLADILPIAKKLAKAMDIVDYNILQVSSSP